MSTVRESIDITLQKVTSPTTLTNNFSLVLLTGLAMNVQMFLEAARASSLRKELFPKQFMDKEFGTLHTSEFGEQLPAGGYPDTGNGMYSMRLSYRDWYRFNILQRIHANYLENMPLALTSLLAAGYYDPKRATAFGLLFILFRALYSWSYRRGANGNRGRQLCYGASLLCCLANIVVFGFHFYNRHK